MPEEIKQRVFIRKYLSYSNKIRVIQLLQGVFGDLTQEDLPILRELLDGEFKTRAQ